MIFLVFNRVQNPHFHLFKLNPSLGAGEQFFNTCACICECIYLCLCVHVHMCTDVCRGHLQLLSWGMPPASFDTGSFIGLGLSKAIELHGFFSFYLSSNGIPSASCHQTAWHIILILGTEIRVSLLHGFSYRCDITRAQENISATIKFSRFPYK